MNSKKIVFLMPAILLIICAFASCAENTSENNGNTAKETDLLSGGGNDSIVPNATEDIYADDLPDGDFGNVEFKIAVQDVPWLYVIYDSEEETGDLLNDAVYKRNRKTEERFNVKITQSPAVDTFKKNVNAGIDAYQLYLPVDRDALTFGAEGLIYKIAEIPNIDITKPYWSQSLNACLTVKNDLYFAYGSFNLSVYDYTHVLLFGKQMISDLGLESPYNLVKSGNWTFDKYGEMAKAAVKDLDGNGSMDDNDMYGLVSIDKHVLPCFWIGAGVQSISKSNGDIPQFTLIGDEKFASVIDKIFALTYDNNSWYPGSLTEEKTLRFIDGCTLFADSTFKGVGDLRSIETDFGIIPYPKYTADQDKYHTRVEGGNPGVVPITASSDLQMIGTVLEALNAESAKMVIPKYYDVTLKTKHARDEESSEMLDLIFAGRVYDLGDTYWCMILRDGIFLTMYSKNDRNLASQLEKVEPKINSEIDKVVNAIEKLSG